MKRIDPQARGSLLAPLTNLKFLGRRPVTEPLGPRPASERYRGFHVNDWEACIGCSTCQKVCDNAAISMVQIPALTDDPARGVRNLRPAIDYGRCCWCALCVDVCPTGSISLSREYVHVCRDDELGSYFILPDSKGIHGRVFERGWSKDGESDLIDHKRQPMNELAADERATGFDEIVAGFTHDQALIEASRCVQCGMCFDACPTHMHAPEYIRAIWRGDAEAAVAEIYKTNPFAHTCGRVCTHRCETACSVGHRGEPIAIRWLKRYAMDQVSPERVQAIAKQGRVTKASGRRVAIVGAGPAGLSTAFDLARKGHAVTVFEAQPLAGGMPRWGIPDYRLPQPMLDRDVAVVESLGVEIRCNMRVGTDITFDSLKADYDAVVLALGLQLGRSTRVPGSDLPGVARAIDLLRAIVAGESIEVPEQAIVIGGGNVAMDIARSLVRVQLQRYGRGAVTITALEDRAHLLADPEELREAVEEGIEYLPARGPQEIVAGDGRAVGLKTWAVRSIFDANGRFAPSYDSDDERIHPGTLIVEAIGQMSDWSLLGAELTEQLEWDRGRLRVDANLRTSEPWLWAAGDAVRGPDVVSAVANGHTVASAIHAAFETAELVT
ncbi:MAG: FAD-dependent oxidoreductase [Chromatiales bacterium]|nr:FAD-dependent oxidoreductase [Chromatiales bacterium]